jgi:hypothetical protein
VNDYSDIFIQVDAQNKFTGKSFEIRPTGVANVDILLPAEWEPTYPSFKNKYTDSERAIEHYSWKKVTTNISGFILGSPTIDHYGDMIVRSSRISHRAHVELNLTRSPITALKISVCSRSSPEAGAGKTHSKSQVMLQMLGAMSSMRLRGGGTASSSCEQWAPAQGR